MLRFQRVLQDSTAVSLRAAVRQHRTPVGEKDRAPCRLEKVDTDASADREHNQDEGQHLHRRWNARRPLRRVFVFFFGFGFLGASHGAARLYAAMDTMVSSEEVSTIERFY